MFLLFLDLLGADHHLAAVGLLGIGLDHLEGFQGAVVVQRMLGAVLDGALFVDERDQLLRGLEAAVFGNDGALNILFNGDGGVGAIILGLGQGEHEQTAKHPDHTGRDPSEVFHKDPSLAEEFQRTDKLNANQSAVFCLNCTRMRWKLPGSPAATRLPPRRHRWRCIPGHRCFRPRSWSRSWR
ncbi:hypothetical protein D3C80_1606070 [compost metagenome]